MKFLCVSLLSTASLLALGCVSQAADLTYEPVAVAEAAPAFDWTGFYFGVHAGAVVLDGELDDFDPYYPGFSDNNTGFIGGVQAGYNWQFDSLVIGAQTDIAYTSAKISEPMGDSSTGFGAEAKLEWLGTTTARLGFAVDNFLLYGKGGIAYGRGSIKDFYNNGNKDSKWHTGWTLGGGGEYAFTQNVTGFIEYDYVDLGSKNYLDDCISGDFTTHIVKVGLNLKY